MKLPWIRSPTSVGLGTETPTPKPSMARPRRMLLDALITNPMSVGPLGELAAVDDHADLGIVAVDRGGRVGNRRDRQSECLSGTPPTVVVWMTMLGIDPSGQAAGRDQVGDRFGGIVSLKRDDDARGVHGSARSPRRRLAGMIDSSADWTCAAVAL